MAHAAQLRVAERAPQVQRGPLGGVAGQGDVAVAPDEQCGCGRRRDRVAPRQRDRPVPVQRRGERGRVGEAGGVALGALAGLAGPTSRRTSRRRPRRSRRGTANTRSASPGTANAASTTTRELAGPAQRVGQGARGRHGDPGDGADEVGPGRGERPGDDAPQSCPTTCARDRPVSASAASTTTAASGDHLGHPVRGTPGGPGTRRVAALVRRERAQAGGGERGRDGLPAARRLREPVQQHHRLPVRRAGRGHVEDQPVPLHGRSRSFRSPRLRAASRTTGRSSQFPRSRARRTSGWWAGRRRVGWTSGEDGSVRGLR